MPDDLPQAIKILLWLLSGTIIFGVLLMKSTVLVSFIFLVIFFALPVWFVSQKKKQKEE